MANCAIRAPESPDGTSTPSKVILPVKYHGASSAYATYSNGEYSFEASEEICKAIDEGKVIVTFEYYEGVPVMIRLTDNALYQEHVPESPD